jgi:hypothetical protein
MEKWRALLSSGEPGEIETRLRRRDGAYRWFPIRGEPLRDDLGNIVSMERVPTSTTRNVRKSSCYGIKKSFAGSRTRFRNLEGEDLGVESRGRDAELSGRPRGPGQHPGT